MGGGEGKRKDFLGGGALPPAGPNRPPGGGALPLGGGTLSVRER